MIAECVNGGLAWLGPSRIGLGAETRCEERAAGVTAKGGGDDSRRATDCKGQGRAGC